MGLVFCPQCNTVTRAAPYPVWVIVVAICFFPAGMLACLAGRKPTTCPKCGVTWSVD